jgi:hypothetical protein
MDPSRRGARRSHGCDRVQYLGTAAMTRPDGLEVVQPIASRRHKDFWREAASHAGQWDCLSLIRFGRRLNRYRFNTPIRRTLRARRERPRRGAAKKRDELASPHGLTPRPRITD